MKSKITNIEQIGDFTNDHGTFYTYEYTFENGDSGQAAHKTQGVDTLKNKVGDEKEYEITTNDHGSKVKFIQANTFQPKAYGNTDPEVQKYIIRQSSLERAQEYFDANGYGDSKEDKYKQNMQLAEIYTNFVLTGEI